MRPRRLTVVLSVIAVLAIACNGDQQQPVASQPSVSPSPTPTTATTATPASPTPVATEPAAPSGTAAPATEDSAERRKWSSCRHPQGITVEYPASWHVNPGDTLPPCSAFDPQPLDVPEAQEFFDAGVLLSVEPVDFATIADPATQSGRELGRRAIVIDGHDAVRIETEAQGDQLLPDGTRSTRWLVVMGRDETLTLTTHETGSAAEYEAHREVLDEMVTRIDLPKTRR